MGYEQWVKGYRFTEQVNERYQTACFGIKVIYAIYYTQDHLRALRY